MMKRNLYANDICRIIEKEVPNTICTISAANVQIAVQFEKRPDIVIHLLSPYYQLKLRKSGIPEEEIPLLISDVRRIAERSSYSDVIIDDVSSYLTKQ